MINYKFGLIQICYVYKYKSFYIDNTTTKLMDSLKFLCLLDVHKQKNTNGFEFSTHISLNVDFGS